jgi:hypothetical protein
MVAKSASRQSLISSQRQSEANLCFTDRQETIIFDAEKLTTRRQSPKNPLVSVRNKSKSELIEMIRTQLGCNYILIDVNKNSSSVR